MHVDLVRNDFAKSRQVVFGRVLAVGRDTVKIECDDANIERALHEPLYDPVSRRHLSLEDGEDFLALLSAKWDGTYVLATAVHDDGECPFAAGRSVPFKMLEFQNPA